MRDKKKLLTRADKIGKSGRGVELALTPEPMINFIYGSQPHKLRLLC